MKNNIKINLNDYKNVWFCSDFHLGHNKEFLYGPRGCKDRVEYIEFMIKGINSLADPDDLIVHVGDVSLTSNDIEFSAWMNRINCKNFWSVTGNHENVYSNFMKEYSSGSIHHGNYKLLPTYQNLTIIEKPYQISQKAPRKLVTLCHFPLQLWDKSHHGTFHLCGHSHNSFEQTNWDNKETGKRFDCGVEAALEYDNKVMFSWEDVKSIMSTKEVFYGDHHNPKTT